MQEVIAAEPRITEYNPLRAQLATIEADNSSLVFDYETEEGAKAARSQIHKLRLTKGALERVRKEVKKEALERGRLIDGEADEIEKRLDACIAVHEKPLKEIAQRESDRQARLAQRLAEVTFRLEPDVNYTAMSLMTRFELIEAVQVTAEDFGELQALAATERMNSLMVLRGAIHEATERDVREQERAAEAARVAQTEREAREKSIAEEAAAQATRDAEAKAKREADAKEREHKAELKRIDDARLAEERRVEQERAEQEKREKNRKHRAAVNSGLVSAIARHGEIGEAEAKAIVIAIASGLIPNIAITY